MKNSILFRLKRKLLVNRINNEVVKDNYIRYINYNYLLKKYQKIIDNCDYPGISKEETKIIWFCWFQGIEEAPNLVKLCYQKLKKNFKDYKVIVITEENFKDYVDIPEYLIDKWKKGIISYAHFSDIIRLYLLCSVGGIWIDSTVYATAETLPKYITKSNFFVFKEIVLNRADNPIVVASNWFIKSNKNNPILLLTRDLLCEYWKDTNILIDYFIFHIFFSMACKKYNELYNRIPTYNNINPHIMQFELFDKYTDERFKYYKSISDFHKLTYKLDEKKIKKDSNIKFILEELNERKD